MRVTIDIPAALMELVEKRARAIGMSRDHLVVRALERELHETGGWTPGFVDALRQIDSDTATAAIDLLRDIRRQRVAH